MFFGVDCCEVFWFEDFDFEEVDENVDSYFWVSGLCFEDVVDFSDKVYGGKCLLFYF